MKALVLATLFSISAAYAHAKDVLYPQEACTEIVSSEYSTGGSDTSLLLLAGQLYLDYLDGAVLITKHKLILSHIMELN